ncbi:meiotically up-regulated protein [Venturia nashicola]|uniref:Meiotically up-regulated protein n=1 Tax=Venturia nashicola TaxID=86259 RepID=A0A4Z1PVS7_9PEZI|nr:meiotically up-regulated protein [Venturia nashicola]
MFQSNIGQVDDLFILYARVMKPGPAHFMSGIDDAEVQRRKFKAPYTPRHTIPTIQGYKKIKEEREAGASAGEEDEPSRRERAQEAYKTWKDGEPRGEPAETDVYPTQNHNGSSHDAVEDTDHQETGDEEEEAKKEFKDTTEDGLAERDAKAQRKKMKHRGNDRAEREVTDPVTHLPVTIHDFTGKDLENAPHNVAPPRTGTGLIDKSDDELAKESVKQKRAHRGMQSQFPTPDYDACGQEIAQIHRNAMTFGLGLVLLVMVGALLSEKLFGLGSRFESKVLRKESAGKSMSSAFLLLLGTASGALAIWAVRDWTDRKLKDVWERHMWEAERLQGEERSKQDTPESTQWLNEILSSVWPLINPDLFTSLADTLEDVMQASLPRLVRMVSVDDIGQGSESIRILGVRWLPTGAAAQSVSENGKLQKKKLDSKQSDRTVPGEGEVQASPETDHEDRASIEKRHSQEKKTQEEQANEQTAEGMEAEEGEFVNVEVAFAYRARPNKKSMRYRAKNAHLYLAFYLPGNIKLPVWVELEGIVGVMRLRLQLTPDPPFFSLCTLTFLGQPKVDMSCVPLTRRGLNVMDLPLISNFVQSAVDAAMAEYVAPKSLTLDLKDMLMGDDFKKDTAARGVLVVKIKRAFDFKQGDPGLGFLKEGSSDPYVTVAWAKFGKPVMSTRVIPSDMEPHWEETAFVLVTPEELNVRESLRLQLWDSDRATADDDLGRIEVDLKSIMKDERSNGKMWDRKDGFHALKAGEGMPGKLSWSVGYYSKIRLMDEQMSHQKSEPELKTIKDLEQKVHEESTNKLREAKRDESAELEQQKAQDLKEREDQIIIATPPLKDYPSGILSIVVHQITGLELEAINKKQVAKQETDSDEKEEDDDLPSSFCTIILNHQKIFKTRTKPKNAKPFFNAGCERFIRDWRNAEVMISVRDARVHEDSALLGIVMLPLKEVFKHRSQINGIWPLTGGVGYGKVRISMVFRSVQLQAPENLLGWEYGTLDIKPQIKGRLQDQYLKGLRIKARTSLGKGKFDADGDGNWKTKYGQNVRLAVRKRFSSPMMLEFRSSSALIDKTTAFSVLWLSQIPDDKEQTITLSVWRGDMARAEKNTLEEYGEKVGEITLTLTLWRGLSGYHGSLASKDSNIADVMEVLDCAQDENEIDPSSNGLDSNSSTSLSSSSSSSDDEDAEALSTRKAKFRDGASSDLSTDGKRGPIEQFKDYKTHHKQLHRKHRGLMQWKGPRTVKWAKDKAVHAEQRVSNLFGHHERESGIETEV